MPHAPGRKARSRGRILASARTLFAAQGFAATSIDAVMAHCGMTRGAFYSHFDSKGRLYHEAMSTRPARDPTGHEPADALTRWFDGCLSRIDGTADGATDARFLVADLASRDPAVRAAYAPAFAALVDGLGGRDRDAALAVAAMAVGAAAIVSSIDDAALKARLVGACLQHAQALLPSREPQRDGSEFFWAIEPNRPVQVTPLH